MLQIGAFTKRTKVIDNRITAVILVVIHPPHTAPNMTTFSIGVELSGANEVTAKLDEIASAAQRANAAIKELNRPLSPEVKVSIDPMQVGERVAKQATEQDSPRLITSIGLIGDLREILEVSVWPGQLLHVELPEDFDRALLEEPTWKHVLRLCGKFHVAATRLDAKLEAEKAQSGSK